MSRAKGARLILRRNKAGRLHYTKDCTDLALRVINLNYSPKLPLLEDL